MPIKRILYINDAGHDMHIVGVQSTRSLVAEPSLVIQEVDGTVTSVSPYLAAHVGVALQFKPTFKAIDTGIHYQGFGIEVDKFTGEVSFVAGIPADANAPNNFLIECSIIMPDGSLAPVDPAVVRVHIHKSTKRIWLTPSSLSIRRATVSDAEFTRYRFTARAEFDDGVLGDITINHGLVFSPLGNFDPNGFFFIPQNFATGAGPTLVTVNVTAPGMGVTTPVSANVFISRRWQDDPLPPLPGALPELELIDGPTWGTNPDPLAVPNILLVGQGFVEVDKPKFDELTTGIVNAMKTDPITVPYDRLGAAMNYWRICPVAASRGVSVRCEVYLADTLTANGFIQPIALPVPLPKRPVAGQPWDYGNLLFMAGLPLLSDGGKTASDLQARWQVYVRDGLPAVIDPAEIARWQRFSNRTLFDEVDTFPAMSRGSRPAAADFRDDLQILVDIDSDRGGIDEILRYIGALQASVPVTLPAGARVGSLWSGTLAGTFKNSKLIVLLTNSRGRAHAHFDEDSGFVVLPLLKIAETSPQKAILGGSELAIDTTRMEIGRNAHIPVFRIAAHELAHVFGLGDEYVEAAKGFAGLEADLNPFANLTTEAQVKSGAGKLDPLNIKWNWERVSKAAVLTGKLAPLGGGLYNASVTDHQASVFQVGEIVLLRHRLPGQALLGQPATSSEFMITTVDSVGSGLTIKESVVNTILPFGAGDLIYSPVATPASVAYRRARMLSPIVEDYIESKNRPLTPSPCDPKLEAARGVDDVLAEEWPLLLSTKDQNWGRRNGPLIVGLYAGGDRAACGIFHPAGWCMMRNDDAEHKGRQQTFCPVCRYALVDLIDPSQHGSIDDLYADIYIGE